MKKGLITNPEDIKADFFSLQKFGKFLFKSFDKEDLDWEVRSHKEKELKEEFIYKAIGLDAKIRLYENSTGCFGIDFEEDLAKIKFQKGLIMKHNGEYLFESVSVKGERSSLLPANFKIFLIQDSLMEGPLMRLDYVEAPFWTWKRANLQDRLPSFDISDYYVSDYDKLEKLGF